MNNNDTPHNTPPTTMDTYTVGHHLMVAGREYLRNAEAIIRNDESAWMAGQMLKQAEQALMWGCALSCHEAISVVDDGSFYTNLSVTVSPEDMHEWLDSQVASVRAMLSGETLPSHRTVGVGATDSPQPVGNVSRETFPDGHSPRGGGEGDKVTPMETHTNPATSTADLLSQLVALIATQVLEQVTEQMETIAEQVAEQVISDHDYTDDVVSDYSFRETVREIANEEAQSLLEGADFTVSVSL